MIRTDELLIILVLEASLSESFVEYVVGINDGFYM